MISIKQKNKIWMLKIEETLAFENIEEMRSILTSVLSYKEKHGQLKQLQEKQRQIKSDEKIQEIQQKIKGATQIVETLTGGIKNG